MVMCHEMSQMIPTTTHVAAARIAQTYQATPATPATACADEATAGAGAGGPYASSSAPGGRRVVDMRQVREETGQHSAAPLPRARAAVPRTDDREPPTRNAFSARRRRCASRDRCSCRRGYGVG